MRAWGQKWWGGEDRVPAVVTHLMAWLNKVPGLMVEELGRHNTIKVNWGPSGIDIHFRGGKFVMVGGPIVADPYKSEPAHDASWVVAWICREMGVLRSLWPEEPVEPGVDMHAEALSLIHQRITRLEQHIIQ